MYDYLKYRFLRFCKQLWFDCRYTERCTSAKKLHKGGDTEW